MSKTHTSFLEVTPNQLTFDNTGLFTSSDVQEVVLRNTGWSDIVFSKIEVVGDYQLDRTGCPTVLKPDQTAKLLVSFKPSSLGSPSGELILNAGKAGHYHVELRGTSSLPFGNIAIQVKTLAELNSPIGLGFADGYFAMVVNDPDPANNGIYEKSGDEWVGPLPAFQGPPGPPGGPGEKGDPGDLGPPGPPADTTVIEGHRAAAEAAVAAAQVAEDAARAEALKSAGSATTAAGHAEVTLTHVNQAEGHAAVANAAVGVAQAFRDDASDYATASYTHSQAALAQADEASSSAGAALQHKIEAESARDAAQTSVNATAQHQLTAGTYADDAGNYAAIATQKSELAVQAQGDAAAKAQVATEKAAEATNAAASASTSEQLTASYASDAFNATAANMPTGFESGGKFWTNNLGNPSVTDSFAVFTFANGVAVLDTGWERLIPTGSVPVDTTQKLKVSINSAYTRENTAGAGGQRSWLLLSLHAADGSYIGRVGAAGPSRNADGNFQVDSHVFDMASVLTTYPTARFARPHYEPLDGASGSGSANWNGRVEVSSIAAKDVASEEAAASSASVASAAATSASADAASASTSEQLTAKVAAKEASRIALTPNASFDEGTLNWTGFYSSLSDTEVGTFTPATYDGRTVLQKNTPSTRNDIGNMTLHPVVSGRKYRVTLVVRPEGAAITCYPMICLFDKATKAYSSTANTSQSCPAGQWTTLVHEWVATGDYLGRAGAIINHGSAAATGIYVDQLYIEDITESAEATTQAGIATSKAVEASDSAANASTSELLSAEYAQDADLSANRAPLNYNHLFEVQRGWFSTSVQTAEYGSPSFGSTSKGPAFKTVAGSSAALFGRRIPIDTSRKYKVRAELWAEQAGSRNYIGLACYDGNGNALGGFNGTFSYFAGTNVVPTAQTWTTYESGVVTGEDNTSVSFPAGTKYVAAMAYINYQAESPGYTWVNEFALEDVTAEDAADTATAQATIATNKAVEASNSASAASTSETLAATHVSQYNSGVASSFPRGFNPALFSSASITGGAPSTITPETVSNPSRVAADLTYIDTPAGEYDFTALGVIDLEDGRAYRLSMDVETIDDGGAVNNVAMFYARMLDANYGYQTNRSIFNATHNLPQNTGDRDIFSVTFGVGRTDTDFSMTSGDLATWKKMRPLILVNRANGSAGTNPSGVSRIHGFWVEDVTEQLNASAQASIATSQAVVATDQAAAAKATSSLIAQLNTGSINPNPNFLDWEVGEATPAKWTHWTGLGGYSRIGGPDGNPIPRFEISNGENTGMFIDRTVGKMAFISNEPHVLELDARAVTGANWKGFGLGAWCYNASGGLITVYVLAPYSDTLPNGGIAAFSGSYIHKWRKLFTPPAGTTNIRLYLFGNYNYGPLGGDYGTGLRRIDVYRAAIRAATQQERDTATVLPAVQASVTTNQGAIADIEGSAAYYETIVAASGSNPAMVQMKAGKNGSKVGIVSDRFSVGNNVDGVIQDVIVVEGGVAKLNNALIRKLKVLPRDDSLISMDVELAPLVVSGKNGDTIQYSGGASFGAPPERIEPVFEDLPGLGAGERWAITTSKSNTSFVPTVNKVTAGSYSTVSSSGATSSASVPTYRANKTDPVDAYNGQYTFTFNVTSVVTVSFQEGIEQYTHEASGDIYAWVSGVLTKVGTYYETWIYTGANGSNSRQITRTVNIPGSIGARSPAFGIEPIKGNSGFPTITWQKQSGGSLVAVNDVIRWKVFAPPRN